jgi:hypothetical protein
MLENKSGPAGSLLSFVRKPGSRAEWVMMGAMGVHWLYQRIRDKRNANRDTVLRFSNDDAPYYWLLRWLETMPRQESISVFRVMQATSSDSTAPCEPTKGSLPTPKPNPAMLVPTEGVKFKFRGIKCNLEKSDPSAGPNSQNGSYNRKIDLLTRPKASLVSKATTRR